MAELFIVDIQGTEVSQAEATILQHPNVGALILFTRNFVNPEQLKSLLASVRKIRPDIIIMIDHEGGIVQRLQRHGFRSLPAARVYGDTFDINKEAGIELAKKYGEIMAHDLLAYGIDLSLAPVLDIHGASNVIGKLDRAFHSNPETAAILAAAFIEGMHKAGMPSVGKHFPGHGSVCSDSHIAMPIYDATEEELRKKDLLPFITLINKKILDAIMPAHVTYTAIDPTMPAGFSKIWLQYILRTELHFNGIVISDCLGMVGADIGNMHTRANQALNAGCDMLIVCNQTRELLSELLHTVNFERTAEATQRLTQFKSKMIRFNTSQQNTTPFLSLNMHNKQEHHNRPKSPDNASLNKTQSI